MMEFEAMMENDPVKSLCYSSTTLIRTTQYGQHLLNYDLLMLMWLVGLNFLCEDKL